MTFAWSPTAFNTLAGFRQYLAAQTAPAWAKGSTIHHTWKPLPADWRGLASMASLGAFYRDVQGWPAGPHLFLCIGAPNPAHDGIFIGTPLATVGVHAGVCNSNRWGIEIVGNFDAAPWPAPLEDLVYGVLIALDEFGHFKPETVNGHRECNSPKTCPGKAINMDLVRAEVKRRATPDFVTLWGSRHEYHPGYGIAAIYRAEHLAGRSLGRALSDELPMDDGAVVQIFSGGAVVWTPVDVKVWR